LSGARSDLLSEGNVPIPLNGQGNPLPPNFRYRGEWILEPRMFLYVPDQSQSTASNAPRFTASLNDTVMIGVSVSTQSNWQPLSTSQPIHFSKPTDTVS